MLVANILAEELLENVIRKQPAVPSESNCFIVKLQKSSSCQPRYHLHGLRGWFGAKLTFQSGKVDTAVEAQAEEPCFFVLASWREPRCFQWCWTGQKLFQIAGRSGSQHIAGLRAVSGL